MTDSHSTPPAIRVVGAVFVVLGVVVFAIRMQHEGAYAVPRGGNLFGGVGGITVGALLLWGGLPRVARWIVLALSPVVLFSALYAIASELEEVISLYATASDGSASELRLWIVDREDAPRSALARATGLPADRLVVGRPGDASFATAGAPVALLITPRGDFEAELDFVHRHRD